MTAPKSSLQYIYIYIYFFFNFFFGVRSNVQLQKMANKAEERVGKVVWISRVNGQVEVDRGRLVWELIGRLSVEHAEVWWSGRASACKRLESGTDQSGLEIVGGKQ